jgi:hypothetical protein
MNKRLIPPLAAILVLILKELFDVEIANEDMESTIEVILLAVGGIGAFLSPKKTDNGASDKK